MCEATNEKHSHIAEAYYKRYELCVKLNEKGIKDDFDINPFDYKMADDCKKNKRDRMNILNLMIGIVFIITIIVQTITILFGVLLMALFYIKMNYLKREI